MNSDLSELDGEKERCFEAIYIKEREQHCHGVNWDTESSDLREQVTNKTEVEIKKEAIENNKHDDEMNRPTSPRPKLPLGNRVRRKRCLNYKKIDEDLEDECEQIFLLKESGQSISSIARTLGCSRATVHKRIQRAMSNSNFRDNHSLRSARTRHSLETISSRIVDASMIVDCALGNAYKSNCTSETAVDTSRRSCKIPHKKTARGKAILDEKPNQDKGESETPSSRVTVSAYQEPLDDTKIELLTQQKKKIKFSKRDIPEYKWTDEGTRKLAEFVKEHPELFDKKQKNWLNVTAKTILWAEAGEELDPPATAAQCKKHYENMRTRVGRILKREAENGSEQSDRSVRDEEIISIWTFLIRHIVRGNGHPSEELFLPKLLMPIEEDQVEVDVEDSQSTNGEVELVPVSRGKGKEKHREPLTSFSDTSPASSITSSVVDTHADLRETFMQILSKVEAVGQTPILSGRKRITHDFACLLEAHMQSIPETSWHNFQIECLNLVQKFKQPHPQQQQLWQPPQQQSWQPSQQQPFQHLQQQVRIAPQFPWQFPQPSPSQSWQPSVSSSGEQRSLTASEPDSTVAPQQSSVTQSPNLT